MRAAAMHAISHGTMGARPGTMRVRVSLAMSLVPITKPESRVSESRAQAAMAAALRMASGVSIITHTRVRRSVWVSNNRCPMSSSWPGVETFGTRIASGAAAPAADRSSGPHSVSIPLMRMNTSRCPKPAAFTAATTWRRASTLASGATESSRSRMTPSTARLRAFSTARAFDPGMYSTLRRGRIMRGTPSPLHPAHGADDAPFVCRHRLHREARLVDQHHVLQPRLGANGGKRHRAGNRLDRFHVDAHELALRIGRIAIGLADHLDDPDDPFLVAGVIEEGALAIAHGFEVAASTEVAHARPWLALRAPLHLMLPRERLRLGLQQPIRHHDLLSYFVIAGP